MLICLMRQSSMQSKAFLNLMLPPCCMHMHFLFVFWPLAMARLLTRVINKSTSSCVFPSYWKYAVVIPVPKSKNN